MGNLDFSKYLIGGTRRKHRMDGEII